MYTHQNESVCKILCDASLEMTVGEEIPGDLSWLKFILEEPNRYQFLLQMLEDPIKAANYITTKCTTSLVQGDAFLFIPYLEQEELARLDIAGGAKMWQCTDIFGAVSDAAVYETPHTIFPCVHFDFIL